MKATDAHGIAFNRTVASVFKPTSVALIVKLPSGTIIYTYRFILLANYLSSQPQSVQKKLNKNIKIQDILKREISLKPIKKTALHYTIHQNEWKIIVMFLIWYRILQKEGEVKPQL